MDPKEILEKTTEETTDESDQQIDSSNTPPGPAVVAQKPIEEGNTGNHSDIEAGDEDPGMGEVIQKMLAPGGPGMGEGPVKERTNWSQAEALAEEDVNASGARVPTDGTSTTANTTSNVKAEDEDPGMGEAIQKMLAPGGLNMGEGPVKEPTNWSQAEALAEEDVNVSKARVPSAGTNTPSNGQTEPAPKTGTNTPPSTTTETTAPKTDTNTPSNGQTEPAPKTGTNTSRNTNEDDGTLDEVNSPILEAYLESGGGDLKDVQEQDGAFDTLQQLKNLKDQQPDENAGNNENNNDNNKNELLELMNKINEARRGNVYAAVVLAKGLENNESNPFTGAGYKRRSRFMNNSKLNKALEINKMASSVNGMLSTVIPNYGKSKVASVITIATNAFAIVGSVRDLMKKIRMYKNLPKINSPGMDGKMKRNAIRTKAFTVLGMISDGVMILNKLCGIAKAATNFWDSGKHKSVPIVAKVLGYLSLAASGATQIMGLASSTNQMLKIKEDIHATEEAKTAKEAEVDAIWDKYLPATRAGTEAARAKMVAKKDKAGQGGQEDEDPNSDKNLYTGDRTYIALRLLKDDRVTEDEKDVLTEYLRLERKLGKLDDQFRDGIYGLVTLSTGLMATITGSVSSAYDIKGVENPTDRQQKDANISSNVNTAAGMVSNSIALVNTGRGLLKGADKTPDNGGDLLKARARGVVEELKGDDYGLKGIAASLVPDHEREGEEEAENENKGEEIEKAKNALKKYEDADKRLKSLGVKYPALMKAANVKEFDAALIAEI